MSNKTTTKDVSLEIKEIQESGLRVTEPRKKILHIFESNEDQHFTADMIYSELKKQGENVGFATVYRVLTQFEEAGLLVRHNFDSGHAVFELKKKCHHDHLVCISCGKIIEFLDDSIEARQCKVAKDAGFEVTSHSLTIFGYCSECRGNTK
ncbi:MAG: ferric iron uptake transcriptional regulator [Gammaproteobacteria bacterium]|nr:MAG: ferric iron uptake transcriptional regulator [Gammaproteobacteria bacterium]